MKESKIPVVDLKSCSKRFPSVLALDDVSLKVYPGECHALVGENGAGKSTLSKCIVGEYAMSAGSLQINGQDIDLKGYSVRRSIAHGIAVVHQEFQLMEEMTGLENIYLGHYSKRGPFIDHKKMRSKCQALKEFLQTDIDFNSPVKYMRTAEKQIVQLARALALDAKLIILDELTAVLPEADIKNIYRLVKLLKDKGIAIIYISHRLNEVFDLCDRYTVLRDGKYIESGLTKELSNERLVEAIAGRSIHKVYPDRAKPGKDLIFEAKNMSSQSFSDINLKVHTGEVVGIAGLVGAGKTELLNSFFGNYKLSSGDILIRGKKVKIKSPRDAIANKLGLIPDERKKLGLNLNFDIYKNTTLASLPRFIQMGMFLNQKRELKDSYQKLEQMKLNYHSLWQMVSSLSGGNQQKVVLAKWILADSDVFIMDEPTRGIDVGGKSEIYNLIKEMTEQGKGAILVSPDIEELLGLSHRIYVLYEGRLMGEYQSVPENKNKIISSILGVKNEQ